MSKPNITSIDPPAGLPGGEVILSCAALDTGNARDCMCLFDSEPARMISATPKRVIVCVPEHAEGQIDVCLASAGEPGPRMPFVAGRRLADELHPVANPAFSPDDGGLFVTKSGSRGQQLPVTIFKLDSDGELHDFSGDVLNPTGIAFDQAGQMYVSSRADGIVYKVTEFKEPVPFARDLGIATGLAFDAAGRLYAGDRTGTIYRINGIGEASDWAALEPTVSAYHLAFGPDGMLYVTGPTVSSYESVWRIDESGHVELFYRGLGRPQGLAFDRAGNLYVAASLRGRRGIVKISPDGAQAHMAVAGMNVVGLAFSRVGEMAVVTTDAVFSLQLGIFGTLLPG